MRPTRAISLTFLLSLLLMGGGTAAAAWNVAGTGAGSAKATSLNAPGSGSTSAATNSSQVVSWSAPSGGAPATGYQVLRGGTAIASGTCSGTIGSTSCTDTLLASGTTYSYTVKARVGVNWIGIANAAFIGNTTGSLTIGSYLQSGNKVTFSGTGSSGTTTISVVVCKVNSFPCTVGNTADTVSVATPSAGSWGPTSQTVSLGNNTNYWARATQGANTSAVFTFTT